MLFMLVGVVIGCSLSPVSPFLVREPSRARKPRPIRLILQEAPKISAAEKSGANGFEDVSSREGFARKDAWFSTNKYVLKKFSSFDEEKSSLENRSRVYDILRHLRPTFLLVSFFFFCCGAPLFFFFTTVCW